MASMEVTRQAELSFLTYLREHWFIKQDENRLWRNRTTIPLTSRGNSLYSADGYYNWVYYVPTGVTGVNYPVVIADDGGTISSANYSINYLKGEVTFSSYTPTGTVTATFANLHHTIRLSGESLYDLERLALPKIVIDEVSSDPEPLQLGGGSYVMLDFTIQIYQYHRQAYLAEPFCSEVADTIVRGITDEPIPIIDYSTYFPLTHSGNRVSSYDRVTQRDGYYAVDFGRGRITNRKIVVPNDPKGLARRQINFRLMVTR